MGHCCFAGCDLVTCGRCGEQRCTNDFHQCARPGELGSLLGIPVLLDDNVPWGSLVIFGPDHRPEAMLIPKTRPSIRYPITEEVARLEGIDLWYFDPKKWPHRVPVEPTEYLLWVRGRTDA